MPVIFEVSLSLVISMSLLFNIHLHFTFWYGTNSVRKGRKKFKQLTIIHRSGGEWRTIPSLSSQSERAKNAIYWFSIY